MGGQSCPGHSLGGQKDIFLLKDYILSAVWLWDNPTAKLFINTDEIHVQKRFVFFMIRKNSSSLTSPSPSLSASSIISWSSSSVMRSPSSLATRLRFLKEIFPVSSSSKSLKAFNISSLGSRLRIF